MNTKKETLFTVPVKVELYEAEWMRMPSWYVLAEPKTEIHQGFRRAWNAVWEELEKPNGERVYTGATFYLEDGTYLKDIVLA